MADPALDRHRRVVLRAALASGVTKRSGATMPAMARYTGVLYKELDWPSLPAAARRRGAAQVRIASGLWGLVAPTDPIPQYKLKMSAAAGDLGRLSTWWKPRLAPLLRERTADALVWDLLPIEHSAAMDWSACAPARRITFRFLDDRDRTVSHWNKLLKGSLVRWLLTDQPPRVEHLADFEHPLGYRFDPGASSLDGPVVAAVLRQRS
jgi:cytoplasmic iron level regulating protein YaaA (DUF328/UPF0246 family)